MEGFQIAAFAPLLAVILCTSLGNCCMNRGLRARLQSAEERIYTLESVVPARPTVVLTPPPPLQRPPLQPQYPLQPTSYYYPQQPYMNPPPSAPRTSSVI